MPLVIRVTNHIGRDPLILLLWSDSALLAQFERWKVRQFAAMPLKKCTQDAR